MVYTRDAMLNKWFCCGLLATSLGLGCLSAGPVDGPPEPNGNRAPIAVSSPGSDYPIASQVTLQGQDSFDPDGDSLLYRWAVRTPDMGETIEAMGAEFVLDLQIPGVYFVELTVEDPHGASNSTTVHVTAFVPVVEIGLAAGQNGAVEIFQQVAVQGSIEVNGTPETSFSWQVLSAPLDSTAQLADTNTLEPSFVADRVGEYVIELRVDSPWSTFKSEVVVTATASQFSPNRYYRAFDYSPAVGKFAGTFMFSAANSQLQILDPSNWAVNEVSFPRPNGMAFTSDGTQIVLGYGTSSTPFSTAVVDTSSGAILQTIPGLSPERLRTAIDNQIVFTNFNSAKTLNLTTHVVNTTSGTLGRAIVSATNAGNKFYSWRFSSPRYLGRLEVTSTGPLFLGPHELAADDCAPLWSSPTEQFMISACGKILRVSDDETLDLTELASLSVTSIEAAVHATSLGLIIVATDEGDGFALRAFNDVTFEEEWVRALPEWYEHQSTQPITILDPRALYMLSDGQTLLVVGQSFTKHRFLRFRL